MRDLLFGYPACAPGSARGVAKFILNLAVLNEWPKRSGPCLHWPVQKNSTRAQSLLNLGDCCFENQPQPRR